MKLRLADHTVRLRVLRSELATLEAGGVLHVTVRLAPGPSGCIAYALEIGGPEQTEDVRVTCACGDLHLLLSQAAFARWGNPAAIGIYAHVDTGAETPLHVLIEKDFACLDRNEEENRDTFAHPHAGAVC